MLPSYIPYERDKIGIINGEIIIPPMMAADESINRPSVLITTDPASKSMYSKVKLSLRTVFFFKVDVSTGIVRY
jgi:hypothetical protein